MALTPKLSNAAASAKADAVCALANSGYLRIYDGTQPGTADDSVTTQNLLAELRFGATAFAAAVNGVATANAITPDSSANYSGTATWFRVLKSNGTDPLWDGSAGATSGYNLNLDSASIILGGTVSVTAFTLTASKG